MTVKSNLSKRRVNTVDAKIFFSHRFLDGKSNKSRGELVDTNFPRFTALGFPITRRSILLSSRDSPSVVTKSLLDAVVVVVVVDGDADVASSALDVRPERRKGMEVD